MQDRQQRITRRGAAMAAGALALALPGGARGQGFPSRPVTLLHGFAAGGTADAISRVIGPPMGAILGQPVVVEPRPGAGGNIAAAALSRAAPDGHTIGLLTGGHAVSAAFAQNLNYEPVEGFAFIGQIMRYAFAIAVRADHPARDLRELIAMARAAPGRLQFGSAGTGSTHQLVGEALNAMAGVEITHVPYRGEAGAITAVMAGDLPVIVLTAVGAIPFARDGRFRVLAVTSPRRSSRLTDVPTVAEAGVPGFDITTWAGLAAPRGTPAPVVARLQQAMAQAITQPDIKARLEEMVDADVEATDGAAMRSMLETEIARWQELIRRQRIQPG